ncbi:MAG TPA: aldehyde dehydrogenase family protein [Candidatus Binataceae bacterium]|jgi:glyceraldehyde-3-phosphate dehydrogenase (NADP+)|nr:aldehyde dehydrogenase family protein [Candidatus Binataceae bacterium]
MATPLYRLFIDGQAIDTAEHYDLHYPYNGEVVGTVARAGEQEADAAIAAAARAFAQTRKLTRARRAEILTAMGRGVAERRTEFERAITLGTGKPIDYARAEVGRTIGVLGLAAEEVKRFGASYEPIDFEPALAGAVGLVERFPLGPIGAIGPFNFPLNLITHKVAPAIATGNTIVVKPPPQCPGPALMLAELATAAGLPAGGFNVISADPPVAERLATDERIRMLSFTGSAKVGWALKAKAGTKRVSLELGGNGPLVIDEGTDLDYAAARTARGAFIHAGQVCISVQRIFVHRRVYQGFLKRLVEATERLGVGDPMDERTIVGPMISREAADRVMEWIGEASAAGAGILTGNRREGNVVAPTLVELGEPGLHRLRVWCEEVFGPVATVEPIENFAAGVAAANDSPYGLQAGVFTNNLEHAFMAFREIEAGAVIVGDTGVFRVDTYPFGGVKGSGLGREGVRWAMEAMTEPRMMVMNLRGRA